MFAILIQTTTGLNWHANTDTVEDAIIIAEEFRSRAEFAIIVPVSSFINFDDERVAD